MNIERSHYNEIQKFGKSHFAYFMDMIDILKFRTLVAC